MNLWIGFSPTQTTLPLLSSAAFPYHPSYFSSCKRSLPEVFKQQQQKSLFFFTNLAMIVFSLSLIQYWQAENVLLFQNRSYDFPFQYPFGCQDHKAGHRGKTSELPKSGSRNAQCPGSHWGRCRGHLGSHQGKSSPAIKTPHGRSAWQASLKMDFLPPSDSWKILIAGINIYFKQEQVRKSILKIHHIINYVISYFLSFHRELVQEEGFTKVKNLIWWFWLSL